MLKLHHIVPAILLFPILAQADDGSPASDMVWLVTASALVFFMQAGFALLESGMSRSKNALNVVMKNYMDVCLGTLVFWLLGYGFMFGSNPSGFIGTDLFLLNDSDPTSYGVLLFQTMFAATAVTIASGAMAERLEDAITQALGLDRAACAAHGAGFTWEASARQFLDALEPRAEPWGPRRAA